MSQREKPAPARAGFQSVSDDAETLTETQSDAIPTWGQHRENWREAELWIERQREGGV
jgi:hypothetical protein